MKRQSSTNSVTSAALLLSPTHVRKKKSTAAEDNNTSEQILLCLKIQMIKLQCIIFYTNEDFGNDDSENEQQNLNSWFNESIQGFDDFKTLKGSERMNLIRHNCMVLRAEDVQMESSFTVSNASW